MYYDNRYIQIGWSVRGPIQALFPIDEVIFFGWSLRMVSVLVLEFGSGVPFGSLFLCIYVNRFLAFSGLFVAVRLSLGGWSLTVLLQYSLLGVVVAVISRRSVSIMPMYKVVTDLSRDSSFGIGLWIILRFSQAANVNKSRACSS